MRCDSVEGIIVNRSRTWRYRGWLVALPVLVALVAVGCAPKQRSSQSAGTTTVPSTITIGATLPLTGTESKAGGFYKQGYDLAFDLANQAGGIDVSGKKVKVQLKLLDDTTDQANAVNLAQRLISQDKVNFMLGTYTTPLVQAQSTVAEQAQIPYVNGGGASTSIYSRGYKWIFGTLASIVNLSTTEMQWIQAQQDAGKLPKSAKIAIVWENSSHGQDFRKGIQAWAKANPGRYTIAVDESFALDGKDFSAVLSKVKAAKVDLFMADAHLPDYLTMQRQYIASGMCNKVITYGARGAEPDARQALGTKGVSYILSAVWWNAQLGNVGLNKTFVSEFKAKYGTDPQWYQAVAYEAARALFTAITQAGSVDKTKVRDALSNLKISSILPGGTLSFPASQGGQASYQFVVQQNLPDGTSPIVYPNDVKKADGIAPNPSCPK
jgi:branched-chain amino acid transport system substrate-binding protein